ncbi:MAG: GAF domain-containing protein, partial [Cellvibrionaceae bacterium]|nr:GAF domain-containing protein [Cellvibrionaceae bacterium]
KNHLPEQGQQRYLQYTGKDRQLDLTLSRQGEQLCLGFSHIKPQLVLPPAPSMPATISNQEDLDHCREQLLDWIAQATGHQRCMYYQFLEDGDGQVLSEVRNAEAEGSYLGLRYPASDIPQIARQLYLHSPWRQIPDARAEAIPIHGDGSPVDLSHTDLRSVSPMHLIYMANMGVAASLSFPIVRSGKLDALISCHSNKPHYLDNGSLQAMATAIAQYTTVLKDFDIRQRLKVVDEFNYKAEQLGALLRRQHGLEQQWNTLAQELLSYFDADGVVLCRSQDTLVCGSVPELAVVEAIDALLRQDPEQLAFYSDNLAGQADDFPLSIIAGAAALKFKPHQHSKQSHSLMLLREQTIYDVSWGGNPNKPIEHHDGTYGIAPRRSFAKWVEKRLGYSKPWPHTIRLELLQLKHLLESSELLNDEIAYEH